MDGSCTELALEGERLCKAGDCRNGVRYFEAAVQAGTNDLKMLGAIYSQLGNTYFYLQDYGKSLEYHRHDLNLARVIGDRQGEAKASGNLGITLKVLGKYDEAVACCEHNLEITRELDDKVGEARALYNKGSVLHAKGKQAGRVTLQDPTDFPADVRQCLEQATECYELNLSIVRDLKDRAAQGRALGNLGNTHYLLGNFRQSIRYHEERLSIAKEFGDKSSERRAHCNLGNAHIFLAEFEVAVDHYKQSLHIARQLGDRALEAQACYSLGNTCTLQRDYDRAIDYHLQHLSIAEQLGDRVGEGRAYWSLSHVHTALRNHQTALNYANKHLQIATEIGDRTSELTAKMNLVELRTMLGMCETLDTSLSHSDTSDDSVQSRTRRRSMENMQLVKLTPDKLNLAGCGVRPRHALLCKAATVSLGTSPDCAKPPIERRRSADSKRVSPDVCDEDSFFEQLSRFQSRRIDDQRCCSSVLDRPGLTDEDKENSLTSANSIHDEAFLDMIAGIQGSRMNDQRADLPHFPGLINRQAVIGQFVASRSNSLDDQFFDMLMRCQGSRIEEQRSVLPMVAAGRVAPTVPDEDFISLIQQFQSSRLEEQRSNLPCVTPLDTKTTATTSLLRRLGSLNRKKTDKKEK